MLTQLFNLIVVLALEVTNCPVSVVFPPWFSRLKPFQELEYNIQSYVIFLLS